MAPRGLPVKTIVKGGLPVTETAHGLPVTESANSYGLGVTAADTGCQIAAFQAKDL